MEKTYVFNQDGAGGASNGLLASILPSLQNRGIDTGYLMGLMNGGGGNGGFFGNNGGFQDIIVLIVIAAIFGNGNFGFGGNNNQGANEGRDMIMQMLNRNGVDIASLAQALNLSSDQILAGINSVSQAICGLGNQMGQIPQMEMVVDVVANINGQNTTFQNLPSGSDIADFGQNGNLVVSCSRDAMNNEISMIKQKRLDRVNSRDYDLSVIASCDEMLTMINPEFAEKQRQEQEINTLKAQMSDMSKNMSELMELNKQLMQQLGVKETTKK